MIRIESELRNEQINKKEGNKEVEVEILTLKRREEERREEERGNEEIVDDYLERGQEPMGGEVD